MLYVMPMDLLNRIINKNKMEKQKQNFLDTKQYLDDRHIDYDSAKCKKDGTFVFKITSKSGSIWFVDMEKIVECVKLFGLLYYISFDERCIFMHN